MDASISTPATRRITPMGVVALLELLAIVGGLGWYFGHRSSAATASMPIDAPAAEATSLPGAGGDLRTLSPTARAAMPPRLPATGVRSGKATLGLPTMPLEELKKEQAQKQRQLESSFTGDPPDPNAAQVELGMLKAMVDPALISDGMAPGNPEVKCHRDSCRVSGDFDSTDDASSWAVNYVTMLGGKLSTSQPVFIQKPDGSVRMQLYGARR
jgi:hypothetical protein